MDFPAISLNTYAMTRLSLVVVVVLGILATSSCSDWDEEEMVRRGNNFVDKIIHEMVEEKGDEYDPYSLEDKVISFHKKAILTNVTGEAKFHNGTLKGLKTLHRTDYSVLTEINDHLIVVAELGAKDLDLRYSGSVKFMKYGPTVTIRAVSDFIKVSMTIRVNRFTGKEGQLDRFKLHEMTPVHVWITGLGPVSWALTSLTGAVAGIFESYVKRAIEKRIGDHIAANIVNYQFPMGKEVLFNAV